MLTLQRIETHAQDIKKSRFLAVCGPVSSEQAAKDQGLEAPTWPEGTHIAFTHWSAGGNGETDTTKQEGVFQYCSAPSGAALDAFMLKYPYTDSPEPGAL